MKNIDFVVKHLEMMRECAHEKMEDFKAEVQKNPVYAMEWKAEAVMIAQAIFFEVNGCLVSLEAHAGDDDIIIEWLQESCDEFASELLGTRFGSVAEAAPWRHTSSCAISNLSASNKLAARREMYAEFSSLIKKAKASS